MSSGPPFPNNLFVDALRVREHEVFAQQDNRRVQAYKAAIRSILAHPLPLPNGKAASELPAIGKSISAYLDEVLKNFNENAVWPEKLPTTNGFVGRPKQTKEPGGATNPPPLKAAMSGLTDVSACPSLACSIG